MTETEKLNEKLAKWAGFEWHTQRTYVNGPMMHGGNWIDGHWDYQGGCSYDTGRGYTGWLNKPPTFTESLDAIFKWLTPKAIKQSSDVCIFFLNNDEESKWRCEIEISRYQGEMRAQMVEGEGETEALALCHAMELLIDEETHGT